MNNNQGLSLKKHWYLFPAIILFLLLYLLLSVNNRLAADDFYYLALTQKGGALYAMKYQYRFFCGRWFAHTLACWFLNFVAAKYFLLLFQWTTLTALLTALGLCFKKIAGSYLSTSIVFIYAGLFCISFFFASYSIAQTWFWYIAVWTYLWSIIAALFLVNELLSQRFNFPGVLVILFTSAFIGGAGESYALIVLLLLFVYLLYKAAYKKQKDGKLSFVKLFLSALILVISFYMTYSSPGTSNREGLLPQTNILEKIILHNKACGILFLKLSPAKLPFLLLFSFPWFFIAGHIPSFNWINQTAAKFFIKTTCIFLFAVYLFLIPTSYALSDIAPGRALSIVSLLFCCYFVVLFVYAGKNIQTTTRQQQRLKIVFALASATTVAYQLNAQYTTTNTYVKAYDERVKQLQDLQASRNKNTIQLKPLPSSGLLYWEELKEDTTFYVNQQLKMGLGLDYQITSIKKD